MQNARSNAFAQTDVDSLRTQHSQLDKRLKQLEKRRTLSAEEEYERQVIKKRKLVLKDQISSQRAS